MPASYTHTHTHAHEHTHTQTAVYIYKKSENLYQEGIPTIKIELHKDVF